MKERLNRVASGPDYRRFTDAKGKEVSSDNLVTPDSPAALGQIAWTQRVLSLSTIRLLRLRNIERVFGAGRRSSGRCGCQSESRYSLPEENIRLWCVLLANDKRGHVRQTTGCELFETGWLVWQPEAVGFRWVEMIELTDMRGLFVKHPEDSNSLIRPLEEWEQLGRSDLKFRILCEEEASDSNVRSAMRVAIAHDVLKRNPNFTHINLMVGAVPEESDATLPEVRLRAAGLEAERLRDRLLPDWQSGDMAIRSFTAYTLRRKDIR